MRQPEQKRGLEGGVIPRHFMASSQRTQNLTQKSRLRPASSSSTVLWPIYFGYLYAQAKGPYIIGLELIVFYMKQVPPFWSKSEQ